MKRIINHHNILITGAGMLIMIFLLNSCVKSRDGATDFSGLKPVVLIPEGGLAAFGSEALIFPAADASDTSFFHVNYAATNVAPADETVTLAIDPAAVATYNVNNPPANPSDTFHVLPDSLYSFTATSVTVTKGDNYTTAIPFVIYPNKIDPTVSYMLPITIQSAPAGSTISGNFATIYFHVIGNPLAGPYNDSSALRYNYVGAAPPYTYPGPEPTPASILNLAPNYPKSAAPNSPTEIALPYANNLGSYIIDFDASYNLTVTASVSGITNFTVYYANYNPATKTIHLVTGYVNGAGNGRIVDETMVHQ